MNVGIIAAARRRSSGVSAVFGALLQKSTANQTISNTPTALDWDTELYDVGGWHSGTSTHLAPPAGVSLVEVLGNIDAGSLGGEPLLEQRKGGSTFVGMGKADANAGTTNYTNIASAPMAVTGGTDYFETLFSQASGNSSPTNHNETWAGIWALDPATRYALVSNSSSQSLLANTNTTLTWDTEAADTSAFHDNSTNPSRLSVPSGVTLVRLRGNAAGGSVTGQFFLNILQNNAGARGLPSHDCDTAGAENINVISAPIVVTPGTDYFEMQVLAATATSVPSADNVWFSIEEVVMPATYQRALVYKSGNQTIPSNSFTDLTWDSEVYDTASIHDTVTNNTDLVVPAGCSYARPILGIRTSSSSAEMSARVLKNGSTYPGMPRYNCDTAGTDSLNMAGAWVAVSPGDIFKAQSYAFTGCTVGTDTQTFFCLECI